MPRKGPVDDIVVLLPGILGSVLERDGRDIWALSPGALLRGVVTLGRSVTDLELNDDDPRRLDPGDGVQATRLMPDVHLIPGFWKIEGYGHIQQWLFDRFDFVDGVNWFDFPYDWRRDNRVAAHRLAEQVPRWLDTYRRTPGHANARVILLGHSMGGLVARHYLEVLGGWQTARALVTFGTPYRGSLNALDFLANGKTQGVGPFKLDLSRMLRSFTSVYQLLPTYPCVDDGSADPVKIAAATGLPDAVDLERVRAAAAFHDEIATAVSSNGGFGRYQITPVAGIFQPTKQSAIVRNGTVTMQLDLAGDDDGGDGTVPRVSATPLELSDDQREVYATESHSALQNVDALLVQVAGLMTWEPLSAHRGTPYNGFSLDLPDVVTPNEPFDVRVSTSAPVVNTALTLRNLDTDVETTYGATVGDDGVATFNVPPLAGGVYRAVVSERDGVAVNSVQDLVVVADDDLGDAIAERLEADER